MELFLAAVERCFERVGHAFERVVAEFDPDTAPPDIDVTKAMGNAYVQLLDTDCDYLMRCSTRRMRRATTPSSATGYETATPASWPSSSESRMPNPERIDESFRYWMWLNVAAAMGVEDLSAGCEWVQPEQQES